MDTMTLTKAAGGIFAALLVFLLGKWAADSLYHVESPGEAAYVIDTGEEEVADDGEEVSFAELMASADADKGASVFKKCAACHKLDKGANSTGPYLYGVVGRQVASADGFSYSAAMVDHGGEWTPEQLSEYLTKPSTAVPGTTMSFAGLNKEADRVNLIAFLNENSDEPYVIEAAAEESPTQDEGAEPAADQDASADEAANDEAPADDATADESATEEAPATDEAAEAAPAEDAATEESASEEAPADEAASEPEPAETDVQGEDEAASENAAPAAASGMLANADLEKGEKVFKKCAACHKLEEGQNVVGPYLYGVVGRPVASAEGFKYSDAMMEFGGDWTPERLDEYLTKPRDVVPGTSMSFAGLRKEDERIDVIGYLDSLDN